MTPEATAAFSDEIVPFKVPGCPMLIATEDELAEPNVAASAAGYPSRPNSGAATLVIGPESFVSERTLTPLVTLETVTTVSVPSELLGYAPAVALRSLFKRTGTSPRDIDVIELDELSAAQAVACLTEANLDPDKVNPYGGAIALGHPVGATGAILTLRVAMDLVRRDLELGVVTMNIGPPSCDCGHVQARLNSKVKRDHKSYVLPQPDGHTRICRMSTA